MHANKVEDTILWTETRPGVCGIGQIPLGCMVVLCTVHAVCAAGWRFECK